MCPLTSQYKRLHIQEGQPRMTTQAALTGRRHYTAAAVRLPCSTKQSVHTRLESACMCAMAVYTAEEAIQVMFGEEFDSGGESEIEEDPAFPLPRPSSDSDSEDEREDRSVPLPSSSDSESESDGKHPDSFAGRSRSNSPPATRGRGRGRGRERGRGRQRGMGRGRGRGRGRSRPSGSSRQGGGQGGKYEIQ